MPDAGLPDLDGDGTPDVDDDDDDGDGISDLIELGNDPQNPVNTDGDGEPDFRDLDSDGDGISDQHEGSMDFDGDGTGNWRDLDSDDDCRGDALERGAGAMPLQSDQDGRPDFLDRDSDDDGLADSLEDGDCDGQRTGAETSALLADTDGDGAADALELTFATTPTDAVSNPADAGFIVVLTPESDAGTTTATLPFRTRIERLDVYTIVDRSGSMLSETNAIRSNLAGALTGLKCPPAGTGDPATCIADLWAGAGMVGYSGTSDAFRNFIDLQPNPNFTSLQTTEPGGCCNEPLTFSVYAAVTGLGSSTSATMACGISSVLGRLTCAGSPASNFGPAFGYPCFREGTLPVIVLVTDEPPLSTGDTNKCPAWSTVVLPQMTARGARLVGVVGDGAASSVTTDLQQMASNTGAVDSTNGNVALVFNGAGTTAATAIRDGVRALVSGLPIDLSVRAIDDPSDPVDAVTAFIAHFSTQQLGTAACSNMLTAIDTDSDLRADSYVNVRAGVPVCWRLTTKPNVAVPATYLPQVFKVTVTAQGDSLFELDRRDVYFYVPPLPAL